MKRFSLVALSAVLLSPLAALAHNGPRIYLTNEAGKLVTNFELHDGATNPVTPHVRVFTAEFGEDSGVPIPGFTEFPGIGGFPGMSVPDLTAQGAIGFNIVGKTLYWNGVGSVDFGATGGETIAITKGTRSSVASADGVLGSQDLNTADGTPPDTFAGPFVPGYTLTTPASLTWHTHPGYSLVPDALNNTDNGVYLLALELTNGDRKTEPFWIVFGQNADHETLETASAWVNANLVPEPASLSVLALGGLALLARRRAR